jgi:hypothetical protein
MTGTFLRKHVTTARRASEICSRTEHLSTAQRSGPLDIDLGEAVVLNGAGRAVADASERLLDAEEKAQLDGRGIWHE